MGPKQYLTELESALEQYRFREVRALTDQIDPATFDLLQIKKALSLIRRKRRFADLEHAASIFSMAGREDPVIWRQWCQSLLDQGRVLQALATLNLMSQKYSDDPVEGPEIRGLIGRAYKQLFVKDGDPESLRAAITTYRLDWEHRQGDYRWHGINLVALLSRAKRDGISTDYAPDAAEIAQQIRDDVEEQGATGIWDYATSMEAAIAQQDERAILGSAKKYIQHPDADAFELASTLRQLKEVWRLEGTAIGNKLLPVLEYAVLQREGGSVHPMQLGKVPDGEGFEAVYGTEAVVRLQWIDTLYRCCTAIGRISNAATGDPAGTGFLMSGTDLCSGWGNGPLFLTNSHVISLDPVNEAPLRPLQAEIEFTRLNGHPRVMLGELVYSSPRIEMDISILRILAPPDSGKLELCSILPKISGTSMQRVYVIGHPKGQELAVSLYDNSLAEYSQQYVRYRSPTEEGNSGSPVLDRQLSCFAVHHRALKEKQLNEGITLEAIIRAIAQLRS
ncbi:MAG TPA: serine protease [Pseudolabrys sp.]|nr:serine protease [Pseudolabrys sp.]